MNRLAWIARFTALTAVGVAGACRSSDQAADSSRVSLPSSGGSYARVILQEEKPHTGPLLVVDSSALEPRVEIRGTDFVLHLPAGMARALYDSLPGFTPLPETNYSLGVSVGRDSPLSVVVGDFNGDSRRDLAMIGDSDSTSAFIFLLAASDSLSEPKIVSIQRPVPHTPTDLRSYYIQYVPPQKISYPGSPETFLILRNDAIHAVSEDVSTIYYLDHGAVRAFSVGGD